MNRPWERRHARRVSRGLDRVYASARSEALEISLDEARLLVLSDQHRGMRDGADDFERCDAAYCAALTSGFASGHTLVVLGDAEELWECRPAEVVAAHGGSLGIEAGFHRAGRYHRVIGNHDDHWDRPEAVQELLGPLFGPGLRMRQGLLLRFFEGDRRSGELFLVHGHQGTCAGDHQRGPMRCIVRHLWRHFQRITHCKLTTPAKDHALRTRHDRAVHAWAARRPGLALVSGHTHKPVFESIDHLGRLEAREAALRSAGDSAGAEALRQEAALRRQKSGGPALALARPCYFNTGCCSFLDGDVTGIEISEGKIRLLRWPAGGSSTPMVLEEAPLRKVFEALRG